MAVGWQAAGWQRRLRDGRYMAGTWQRHGSGMAGTWQRDGSRAAKKVKRHTASAVFPGRGLRCCRERLARMPRMCGDPGCAVRERSNLGRSRRRGTRTSRLRRRGTRQLRAERSSRASNVGLGGLQQLDGVMGAVCQPEPVARCRPASTARRRRSRRGLTERRQLNSFCEPAPLGCCRCAHSSNTFRFHGWGHWRPCCTWRLPTRCTWWCTQL
jgi:hypothetical protein